MKRYFAFALVLAAAISLMTGCRFRSSTSATNNTTRATGMTMPSAEDMIPGPEDTIAESNGANRTEPTEDNASVPTENTDARIRPRDRMPGK